MASSAVITDQMVTLGMTFNRATTASGVGDVITSPTLAAAKTGTLTTRTSATVGTLTMTTGHGIITGDKLSIFWSGGQRNNVTVGTVSGDSVPFTVGTGDDLPVAQTAVTAQVPTLCTFSIPDVTEMVALASGCAVQAGLAFKDGSAVYKVMQITGPTGHNIWDSSTGATNPLASAAAGVNASVYVAQADSTQSQVVNVVALLGPLT